MIFFLYFIQSGYLILQDLFKFIYSFLAKCSEENEMIMIKLTEKERIRKYHCLFIIYWNDLTIFESYTQCSYLLIVLFYSYCFYQFFIVYYNLSSIMISLLSLIINHYLIFWIFISYLYCSIDQYQLFLYLLLAMTFINLFIIINNNNINELPFNNIDRFLCSLLIYRLRFNYTSPYHCLLSLIILFFKFLFI